MQHFLWLLQTHTRITWPLYFVSFHNKTITSKIHNFKMLSHFSTIIFLILLFSHLFSTLQHTYKCHFDNVFLLDILYLQEFSIWISKLIIEILSERFNSMIFHFLIKIFHLYLKSHKLILSLTFQISYTPWSINIITPLLI